MLCIPALMHAQPGSGEQGAGVGAGPGDTMAEQQQRELTARLNAMAEEQLMAYADEELDGDDNNDDIAGDRPAAAGTAEARRLRRNEQSRRSRLRRRIREMYLAESEVARVSQQAEIDRLNRRVAELQEQLNNARVNLRRQQEVIDAMRTAHRPGLTPP